MKSNSNRPDEKSVASLGFGIVGSIGALIALLFGITTISTSSSHVRSTPFGYIFDCGGCFFCTWWDVILITCGILLLIFVFMAVRGFVLYAKKNKDTT